MGECEQQRPEAGRTPCVQRQDRVRGSAEEQRPRAFGREASGDGRRAAEPGRRETRCTYRLSCQAGDGS